MFRKFRLAFGIMILTLSIAQISYAQEQGITTKALKEKALQQFASNDYSNAYRTYTKLLSLYPKDGLYNYYSGLCLYFQNKEIPKSIEHLIYASGKAQVPPDVFYYLGLAYRKNYMFKDSKSSFKKFISVASRTETKELMPAREAEMSGNAMISTLEYNPFEIIESSLISFSDSLELKQVWGKGGVLNKKMEALIFQDEKENNLSSYLFLPKEISRGTFVYLSSYGKSKKKGLELFRVKKLNGKNWGEPEALVELNTEFDEIMPYFDPVSKNLYFASKGYNSIGGFDVFTSHYDEERNSWSEPINLGFPINSPQNDFIAIPGYDLGTLLIITDRQELADNYTVYKLKIREPKKSLASASNIELSRIGNFGGISSITRIIDLKKEDIVEKEKEIPEIKPEAKKVDVGDLPIQTEKTDIFTLNVNTALTYQAKADSLTQLSKKTRLEVKDISDPDERWNLQKKIIEWGKLALEFQEKANHFYSLLEEKKENEISEIPPEIQEKTVINDIIVYEYSDEVVNQELNNRVAPEKSQQDKKKADYNTTKEPGDLVTPVSKTENYLKRFIILESSPYSSNNPIPLDVKLPEGSFYRIQLGAFGNMISQDVFGGLSPLTAESIKGKKLTRYYAGKFSRYANAVEALSKVKSEGYKDAYIVGWYNGEKMSLDRLREFEKRDLGEGR